MPYLDLASVELAFGLLEQTLLPRGHWLVERGAAGQRAVQPDGGALARSSEEARAVGASTEADARMIAVTFLHYTCGAKTCRRHSTLDGCGAPIRVHYFVSNAARTKDPGLFVPGAKKGTSIGGFSDSVPCDRSAPPVKLIV